MKKRIFVPLVAALITAFTAVLLPSAFGYDSTSTSTSVSAPTPTSVSTSNSTSVSTSTSTSNSASALSSTEASVPCSKEKISIIVMDCYDPVKYVKLTHQDFVSRKEQWLASHPEVEIKETVLRVEDYGYEISYYASQKALPDIFLLEAESVKLWTEWDLLADITDALEPVVNSAAAFDYCVEPFLLDGKAYTFPAFSYSPVIIAYDREALEAAGYESFPETWEELESANPAFQNAGYESVLAFYEVSAGNLTSRLMPRIFAENCGEDWLRELCSGNRDTLFIRSGVSSALEELRQIVESEVLSEHTDPVEAYLEGKCPAAVLTTDDLPALQQDQEKWSRTAFSLLPVSEESPYHDETRNTAHGIMSYALAISSKVAEDSEKLQTCLDFCSFVSGSEPSADYSPSTSCHADSDAADFPAVPDPVPFTAAAYDAVVPCLASAEIVPNFCYYISSGAVSGPLESWIAEDTKEEYTAAEIINAMQDQYERNPK